MSPRACKTVVWGDGGVPASHAYGIMNNTWTYKGQYKLTHSGGTTYYTNTTNGLVTTNSSEYGEWKKHT